MTSYSCKKTKYKKTKYKKSKYISRKKGKIFKRSKRKLKRIRQKTKMLKHFGGLSNNDNNDNNSSLEVIEIDGSKGEGGGQMIRLALGLSVIYNKSVRFTNIRKNRIKPDGSGGGLKEQHLTIINNFIEEKWGTVDDMDTDTLRTETRKNPKKGIKFIPATTKFTFIPTPIISSTNNVSQINDISNNESISNNNDSANNIIYPINVDDNDMIIKIKTAGAITLILQAILPVIIYKQSKNIIKTPFTLKISGGGTNVSYSPPIDHFVEVLNKYIERMGIKINTNIKKRGFFPYGGGEIVCTINKVDEWNGLLIENPTPCRANQTLSDCESQNNCVYNQKKGCTEKPILYMTNIIVNGKITDDEIDEIMKIKQSINNANNVDNADNTNPINPTNLIINPELTDKRRYVLSYQFIGFPLPNSDGVVNGVIRSANGIIGVPWRIKKREWKSHFETKWITKLEGGISKVKSQKYVDEHTADQLLIFMVLSWLLDGKESKIECVKPTESDHLETAIDIINKFSNIITVNKYNDRWKIQVGHT